MRSVSKRFVNVLQNFLSLVHDFCETFANCFDVIRVAIFVTDVVIGSDVTTLLLVAERSAIEIKRFGLVLARTSLVPHKTQHYICTLR